MKLTIEEIDKQIKRLKALKEDLCKVIYDRDLYQISCDSDGKIDITALKGRLNPSCTDKAHNFWLTSCYGPMGIDEVFASVKSAIHFEMVEVENSIKTYNKKLSSLNKALIDPKLWETEEDETGED